LVRFYFGSAQKQALEAVAVDMWEPLIQTLKKEVLDTDIVHDKFHVSPYLGEAMDKVRSDDRSTIGEYSVAARGRTVGRH